MNIKKPPHVTEEVWKQHLTWMEVMDLQVKANRKQHKQKLIHQPPRKNT